MATTPLLTATDQLLDQLEQLNLEGARILPTRTREDLGRIRELLNLTPGVPRRPATAHSWLLDAQAGLLHPSPAITPRVPYRAKPGEVAEWRTPDRSGASPELFAERLFQRWCWAAAQARRRPGAAAFQRMQRAWRDYLQALDDAIEQERAS